MLDAHSVLRSVDRRGRFSYPSESNMTNSADTLHPHIETTAEIVAAYVSRNSVPVSELPNLIRSVHDSLSKLGSAPAAEAPTLKREPAVSIRKSVTDEFIISLEDGRKFRSMKRYLAGLGMTPADYRAKWGLPADYPMVAPAYAKARSELAKSRGLGRRGVEPTATATAALASHGALAKSDPTPVVESAAPANDAGKKTRKRVAKAA